MTTVWLHGIIVVTQETTHKHKTELDRVFYNSENNVISENVMR